MQLRRVAVRNIRSHERTEVEFPPGTTLLAGDVGAGKTSLLYAMEMALFGFAEVDATYLIRHAAPRAEVALTLVEGGTTHELRRSFRRRTVKGRDLFQIESNSYARDGVEQHYSATELRLRSIELLGFPDNPNPRAHSDLWRWAVYIPQERMREVLDQSPTDRLATIRKVLGVERYRTAADNARLVARELDQLAERRQAEAQGLAHFSEAIDRIDGDQRRLNDELAALRRAERAASEALQTAEDRLKKFETARVERGRLLAEALDLRSRRDALQSALAALESRSREAATHRAALEQELAAEPTLADQASSLDSREQEIRTRRAEVESDLEQLRQTLSALEVCAATIRATQEAVTTASVESEREARHLRETRERLAEAARSEPVDEPRSPASGGGADLDARLKAARDSVDRLREGLARSQLVAHDIDDLLRDGRCPRCHQAVRPQEFEPHRTEALLLVRESSEALQVATEQLTAFEERRAAGEALERAHAAWVHLEERRRSFRAALADGEARYLAIHQRREAAGDRLRSSEAELARLMERRDSLSPAGDQGRQLDLELDRIRSARLTAVRRLAEIRARRPELARLAEETDRLRRESADRSTEVQEVESRLASTSTELARFPNLDEDLAATRLEQEATRQRLDEAHRRQGNALGQLERADVELRVAREGADRQTRLNSSARRDTTLAAWLKGEFRESMMTLEQRLLRRAHAEFQAAFARYFHALVDDPSLDARLDAAFAPAVEIEGEWTPADALSGGERTALALAYRLALGHVVRSFGELRLETLILDEPTDGFSPEQVLRMGELLTELRLPQVVIVSHEAALGAFADHVIRLRKEGGVSMVSSGGSLVPTLAGPPDLAATPDAPARRTPRKSGRRRKSLEELATPPPAS